MQRASACCSVPLRAGARSSPAFDHARLNDHIVRAVRSPELAQRFAYEGVDVVASSPAQLASHIKAELARWAKVVKQSEGLRAD